MIGFPLGILAANASEWLIHKYVLHGLGAKKDGYWSFHWHEHHREVRRQNGRDPMYERPIWEATSASKEALGLIGAALFVAPLLPLAPGFVAGVWTSSAAYYYLHRRSHLDPAWAREWLPWHYDHHMGRNQHANWCVTWPLFDWVMGTRDKWAGTEAEAQAMARAAARRAASQIVAAEGSAAETQHEQAA